MSGFYGTTSGTAGVGIQQSTLLSIDRRLLADYYRDGPWPWVQEDEAFRGQGFSTPWWPRRSALDASASDTLEAIVTFWPELNSGAVSKAAFTGVTRDAYGSILGSCVVKLFKTVTTGDTQPKDVLLDQTTSDPTTGAFTLLSPYMPDTHYIVAFKAGSPDVQGSTPNTLIGA